MSVVIDGTTGITTPGLTNSGTDTLSSGTANGVAYLNGSKVLTTGSALVFDGTNFGLGVTPSAWQSIYRALDVPSGSFFGRNDGGIETGIYANAYRDSAGTRRYKANGVAMRYEQSADGHTFFTAPSGTAGNAITFTQAMTLDASGNLGIGRTTFTEKLSVQNTSATSTTVGANVIAGFRSNAVGADTAIDLTDGQSYSARFGQISGAFYWMPGGSTERMRLDTSGNLGIGTSSPSQALTVNGAVGYNAPVTVTGATYSVLTTDNWIIANRAGTVTLTLPTASSFTGRILTVKNVQAQTVVSNASNVVPIGSTTAGTAILTSTAGKFATLVSDGTNWIIMQAN